MTALFVCGPIGLWVAIDADSKLVLSYGGGIAGDRTKLENHVAAVALNYFAYNFIRIHRTLRISPAMAAGVTTKLWAVSDLVALLAAAENGKKAA